MMVTIEDVLAAICTQSKLFHTNDFQNVYALASPAEAKLAYDILVAYGLDVKVYHQAGKMSKLYVTHPAQPSDQLEKALIASKAYAVALKQIKQNLDQLCRTSPPELQSPEYSMTFANSQSNGKQILIQITPATANSAGEAAPENESAAPEQIQSTQTAPAVALASDKPKATKKYGPKPKGHYEELSSGPQVAKMSYPGKLSKEGDADDSIKKKVLLYLFGNLATSTYSMFIQIFIVAVIFSVVVMVKAYMCADFAVANKNRAWYCSYNDEEAAQKRRAEEEHEQRQRALGLQPTNP